MEKIRMTPPVITTSQLPLLRGDHVYLSFATEADREPLRPLAKDDRIWEFTQTLMVTDTYDAQFDGYFDGALATVSQGQAFVIRRSDTGTILGMTRIHSYTPKDRWAEIGHTWYLPSVWGQVHNKECKLLLLQFLFEQKGLCRVQFRVAHQNLRSQKAVAKIGGTKEGILRKHGFRNDGQRKDTVVFSIIDDEWPEKKAALQALIASYASTSPSAHPTPR
ncbi:MAG TPA: GNAT family protein [Puia sp.]|nr:GNAT family protein [Puia sp.]